jgi:hypothetical protein
MQTYPTPALSPEHDAFSALVETIATARNQIASQFLTIGQALNTIKTQKLYQQGDFTSFAAFLHDPRIDIAPADAERFMSIADDPAFHHQATLGLSKMLELLKLPAADRQKLLTEGAELRGRNKSVEEMNLRELRQASQELRREGKQRCERCNRWVDEVRELDGRCYGAGGTHTCYELELEERRALTAGRIPAPQLDHVLENLRFDSVTVTPETPPLQWLPDSLYQLYGQLLQDSAQSGGEVSAVHLQHEQATLKKLVHLCQSRLREIQETLEMLRELEPMSEGSSDTPPWD